MGLSERLRRLERNGRRSSRRPEWNHNLAKAVFAMQSGFAPGEAGTTIAVRSAWPALRQWAWSLRFDRDPPTLGQIVRARSADAAQ